MATTLVTPRSLSKVLAAEGITLTRKQRADLLAGSESNLTRRVKNFIAKFKANGSAEAPLVVNDKPVLGTGSLKDNPFPFLELINGMTSGKVFRVIARLGSKGAVVAHKYAGEFKVKCYPDFATFGLDREGVSNKGGQRHLHRTSPPNFIYDRFFMDTEPFKAFFESLRDVKGIEIASPANTEVLFSGGTPTLELQKPVTVKRRIAKILSKRRPSKK